MSQLDIRELGCPCDLPPQGQRYGGLGLLEEAATLLEKLAEPAALAYATYQQDKQQKQDLRARRAEAAANLEASRVQAQAEVAKAQAEAPVSVARTEQAGDVVKLALSAVAVVAAGAVAFKVGKLALEALKR